MKRINMIGQRFGRWTVIREAGKNKHRSFLWECLCLCGNIKILSGDVLRNGNSKSCGCYNKERIKEANTIHGMHRTPTYKSWSMMKNRCNNPNNPHYLDYGGRKIIVCNRWLSFINFFKDMGERPEGTSIDRKNPYGNYEPSNCRWATPTEQQRNQRLRKSSTTGAKGIHWHKQSKKYCVRITADYKEIYVGLFTDLEKAKKARKMAELKYWG